MLSCAKFVARFSLWRRLAGSLVQHQAINPFAKSVIGIRFHISRSQSPMRAGAVHHRKRFRHGFPFSINMGGGCGLLKIKSQRFIAAVFVWRLMMPVSPKFAGGHV